MAKMSVGAQVIAQPRNASEQWLFNTVAQHAKNARIGMPEIAVYDAPEMNAFATGASKNHALVAVSTGLLQSMNRDEVSAVLGHEISHVANGDMVTMALIQGVLNTFVIFLARVIGTLVDRALSGNRDGGGGGVAYFAIVMVLQLVLGALASLVVMAFSRWREFRADAGGAHLAGRGAMISALERLAGNRGENTLPKAIAAFGISGEGGVARLFMSHPPLAERIAALRAAG
jgi:heat shock protein HtpX